MAKQLNNESLDTEFNYDLEDYELAITKSEYYDLDNMCEVMRNISPETHLSFLNLNARSLIRNFNELCILLSALPNPLDIIAIEETWLNESLEPLVAMDNYTFISKPKLLCKEGGGLGVYIKNGIKFFERPDLACPEECRNSFDSVFIELPRGGNGRNIIVGLFYRAPNQNTIKEYTDYVSSVLAQVNNEKKDIIYLGDANINLLKCSTNKPSSEYLDMLLSHGLLPKITVPTRVVHDKGTLIDHMFVKLLDSNDNCITGTLTSDITDHFMNFLFVESKCIKPEFQYISYRSYTDKNITKFNDALTNSDMDKVYSSSDPNSSYDCLVDIYTQALDNTIPIKTARFNKYRHKKEPWITHGILNSIKERDKLHTKLRSEKNDSKRNLLRNKYNTYRNSLSKIIRKVKFEYQKEKFAKCKHDSKLIWQNINDILNRTRNKLDFPNSFSVDGVTISDLKDIANSFNDYYVSVGPNLAKNIKPSTNNKLKLPTVRSPHSFFMQPCDFAEVAGIIKNLKPKSSFGHDNMTPRLLIKSYTGVLEPLTYVINLSLEHGVVPDAMKVAKVSPIYKNSGNNNLIKNYRPVSLLPVFSKVLERIVYNRLYKYITKHALLSISQYGFQKGLSTELAILELQDRVAEILGDSTRCLGIFMDLSKAFDTLDHQILLYKLEHYGVRGIALDWFKSYLSGRTQYVSINNTDSDVKPLTCGVPQGSILGPLLFLIYINDLALVFDKGIPILFADDSNGIYIASNYKDLTTNVNTELRIIAEWFRTNKLAVNESKTKYMLFHTRGNNPPEEIVITLNDKVLERVCSTKFLGVLIHETLSWQTHINHLCTKLSKVTAVLSRIKHQLPVSVLRIIYNSLFASHTMYGLSVWGSSPHSHMERLIKLQKKAVRHVVSAKYNSHTEPIFKKLNVLSINDAYKLQCCKIYYKEKQGSLHNYHSSKLQTNMQHHSTMTRQSSDINISRWTKNVHKQTINFKIGTIWNALPREIRNVTLISEHSFAKKLKKYLISQYRDNCEIQNCYICKNR